MDWKDVIFVASVSACTVSGLQAFERDIILEGDSIEYNQDEEVVEASGNAKVFYKDIEAGAEKIKVKLSSKNVEFDKMFHVKHGPYVLEADSFTYDNDRRYGEFTNLSANVENWIIIGSKAEVSMEEVVFEDAVFTTCDNEDVHYSLKCKQVTLFPTKGEVVGIQNTLYLPFLPVPIGGTNFIYSSDKHKRYASPFPMFGSNRREGWFFKQELGYLVSQKSTGVFGVGMSEKRGRFVGLFHQQVIDDWAMIQADIHYTREDQIEGGVDHHLILFRQEGQKDINNLKRSLQVQETSTIRLITEIKEGDLIQDSRVDKQPYIQLKGESIKYHQWDTTFDWVLGGGRIREETRDEKITEVKMTESQLKARKRKTIKGVDIEGEIEYTGYWYEESDDWQRIFLNMSGQLSKLPLNPKVSVRKGLINFGETPFEFQTINAVIHDEIGVQVSKKLGSFRYLFEGNYQIHDGTPRELIFQVGKTFHCWGIKMSWDSVNKRFNFGINLL